MDRHKKDHYLNISYEDMQVMLMMWKQSNLLFNHNTLMRNYVKTYETCVFFIWNSVNFLSNNSDSFFFLDKNYFSGKSSMQDDFIATVM